MNRIPKGGSKYYTANVDADGVMTFPEDFLKDHDWRPGDEISFKIDGETIIMRNCSKEIRER
jgi:bifunctional DNA-binding transcriptional regulator/antitoxin component of YhaV-PrlF toxin-antitoxin module